MSTVLDAPCCETCETVRFTQDPCTSIHTTLFELISALQDAAGPGNDATVVAAVADLVETGRIRLLDGIR